MPSLKLLLIEDTPADATLFISQIQDSLGVEVEVEWRTRLTDAVGQLEAVGEEHYDQIWLDPGLPDLGSANIGKALALLKKYVPAGELRLLSGLAQPAVAKQAESHNVAVVSKASLQPSGNQEILEMVKELLAKRSSSGATTRVEMARYEGKLANLEYKVEENSRRLEKIEQGIDRMNNLAFELSAIKDLLGKIPALEQSVREVKSAQSEAKKASDAQWDFRKAAVTVIAGGLITGVIGVITTLGPILIPRLFPDPDKPAPIVNQQK